MFSVVKTTEHKRRGRVAALQCLFAGDISATAAGKRSATGVDRTEMLNVAGFSMDESLSWLAEEDQLPRPVLEFARRITEGVTGHRPELDEMIQRYAPAWPVSQLATVDRNTLRIALYELLHSPDTPRRTAVNEAVDLAKEFGSESSGRFVNGVLGSVMAELDSTGLVSV